ncbi:MAG: hypothetical protein WAT79_09715 [Saprospiraceae bacterium]
MRILIVICTVCIFGIGCSHSFSKIPTEKDDIKAIQSILLYMQDTINKREFYYKIPPIHIYHFVKVDTGFYDYGYKMVNFTYESVYIDTTLAPLIRKAFLKDKSDYVDIKKLVRVKRKKFSIDKYVNIMNNNLMYDPIDFKSLDNYVYYFSPLIPHYDKRKFSIWVRLEKQFGEPKVLSFLLTKSSQGFDILNIQYIDYFPVDQRDYIHEIFK